MNNAITEIKNTLEGTNSRIKEAEDRISEVEDKMVEINETERKKEKQIKRNEDNLRDIWDNVKCPSIRIIGVPEEEDKKKDHEKILEEITVENFPKMEKEIATQVQETQRVPKRIKPRQNTQFNSVQLLSRVQLFATPWTAARQASLSITNSHSLLKLMSIESVMPSNHLILCCPLRLLPSMLPSTRVFPVSLLFTSSGQRIGASAPSSVLPMNTQD